MRKVAAALALILIVVACGGTTDPDTSTTTTAPIPAVQQPDLLRADLPRHTRTDLTASELAALVEANSHFAFDLYRLLADDTNLIFSPYSIASALTMTLAGARGDTAAQISEALHAVDLSDRIHTARNELDLRIATPPPSWEGDQRDPFTISVANSLWGQAGYPFLEEFLSVLAVNYDAGMNLVDFENAAEGARVRINHWVEEQTEGRIVELIPEDAVNDLTRLVLVNAIWFKANWLYEFDSDLTRDDSFTLLDGSPVTVPMMSRSVRTGYMVGDGYQAARLPYVGDAAMIVILPDERRFHEIAAGFGPEDLDRARQNWGEYQLELSLPRFEFGSDFSINDTLQDLGVVAAFVDPLMDPNGADFTGMTAVRELFITDTFHQAFISVDEEGTEASAATAIIVGRESMPLPATFIVDRPFIFLIEHASTGEILFVGQVTDPR